jgi:hypothetical protein
MHVLAYAPQGATSLREEDWAWRRLREELSDRTSIAAEENCRSYLITMPALSTGMRSMVALNTALSTHIRPTIVTTTTSTGEMDARSSPEQYTNLLQRYA